MESVSLTAEDHGQAEGTRGTRFRVFARRDAILMVAAVLATTLSFGCRAGADPDEVAVSTPPAKADVPRLPAEARGLPIVSCEALRKHPLVGALIYIREQATVGHLGLETCDGGVSVDEGAMLLHEMRGIAERDLRQRHCDGCEIRSFGDYFTGEVELCFAIRRARPSDEPGKFRVNGRRLVERDGRDIAIISVSRMTYTYADRRGEKEELEMRELGSQVGVPVVLPNVGRSQRTGEQRR